MEPSKKRPRVEAIVPLFMVKDLKRSLDFYTGKLGFTGTDPWGDPPCFAIVTRDGFELMLKTPEEGCVGEAAPNGGVGAWDVYLRVGDLAAEAVALKELGVTLTREPEDTFYGMRELEFLDPDGNLICFAQDISSGARGYAESWEGVLEAGERRYRLIVRLEKGDDGVWTGALDTPDQGTMNLPIDTVERDDSRLRFEMRGLSVVFEGTIVADEARGQWTQRGRDWPITFKRA